jgi:hypothetical protein
MAMSTSPVVFAGWSLVGLLLAAAAGSAQDFPKPGPQHALLRQWEGTWDAAVKTHFGPGQASESKGTMTCKMDLGGFWLLSRFEGEFADQKFQGQSIQGYDSSKKKTVSIWIDSMSDALMVFEGSFDKDGKVLTETAEGPDMTGKPTKFKSVTQFKDKDTILVTLATIGAGGKEQVVMTITYTRKK